MEIKVSINLTEKHLSNLLETASYGNYSFEYEYEWDESDTSLSERVRYSCDRAAYLLMHGSSVDFMDIEDEFSYKVDINLIESRICELMFKDKLFTECMSKLINDDRDFDQTDAYNIVQYIMFGESIYC